MPSPGQGILATVDENGYLVRVITAMDLLRELKSKWAAK